MGEEMSRPPPPLSPVPGTYSAIAYITIGKPGSIDWGWELSVKTCNVFGARFGKESVGHNAFEIYKRQNQGLYNAAICNKESDGARKAAKIFTFTRVWGGHLLAGAPSVDMGHVVITVPTVATQKG